MKTKIHNHLCKQISMGTHDKHILTLLFCSCEQRDQLLVVNYTYGGLYRFYKSIYIYDKIFNTFFLELNLETNVFENRFRYDNMPSFKNKIRPTFLQHSWQEMVYDK